MPVVTPSTRMQGRAVTPPPRRRDQGKGETEASTWSVQAAGDDNADWTSSPVPYPGPAGAEQSADRISASTSHLKVKGDFLTNFSVLKVNEEDLLTSPKPSKDPDDLLMSANFISPRRSNGKENRPTQPVVQGGLSPGENWTCRPPQTPAKTPNRLPTVKEHEVQEPGAEELDEPAWVVQTPKPSSLTGSPRDDVVSAMLDLGLLSSPTPPGLECDLPAPSVRSTFIQYVSPLKTVNLPSPPKTVPSNFAPAALYAREEALEALARLSDSPLPWPLHEQIPFFPAAAPLGPPATLEPCPQLPGPSEAQTSEAQTSSQSRPSNTTSTVVRLSDFLPEPSAASLEVSGLPMGGQQPDMSQMNGMQDWYMMQSMQNMMFPTSAPPPPVAPAAAPANSVVGMEASAPLPDMTAQPNGFSNLQVSPDASSSTPGQPEVQQQMQQQPQQQQLPQQPQQQQQQQRQQQRHFRLPAHHRLLPCRLAGPPYPCHRQEARQQPRNGGCTPFHRSGKLKCLVVPPDPSKHLWRCLDVHWRCLRSICRA